RILLPGCPSDVADKLLGRHGGGVGFVSHLRSSGATMSQKSSVPQHASFVSWALKRDMRPLKMVPAANSSLMWMALLSPDTAANRTMSAFVMVLSNGADLPTRRSANS